MLYSPTAPIMEPSHHPYGGTLVPLAPLNTASFFFCKALTVHLMVRHQGRVSPGFRWLNIFLQAMYCNGPAYLLPKASTSQPGVASTGPHGLHGDQLLIENKRREHV